MNSRKKQLIPCACALALSVLFLANPMWAADRYVSDDFEITMRSGPGASNNIKRMLTSGTPLTVLQEQSSWIKVRTPQGTEGWIMKRYAMEQTPKEEKIEKLQDKIKALKSNQKVQLTQELKEKNQNLQDQLKQTQSKLKKLQERHAKLKAASGQVMQIKKDFQSTQKELQKSKQKISSLQEENSKLRSHIRLYWFIAGGSIVFVSALIGFVLGRLQRKKSKKVYF
mgnify:CR=1 FL=1